MQDAVSTPNTRLNILAAFGDRIIFLIWLPSNAQVDEHGNTNKN